MAVYRTERWPEQLVVYNLTQYFVARVTNWPTNEKWRGWSRSLAKPLSIHCVEVDIMVQDSEGDWVPSGETEYTFGWKFYTYPFYATDPATTDTAVYGAGLTTKPGTTNLGQLLQWVRSHDDAMKDQFEAVMVEMDQREAAGLDPWIRGGEVVEP